MQTLNTPSPWGCERSAAAAHGRADRVGPTRRFFARALNATRRPTEVTTDRAPAYPRVLDEVVPVSAAGVASLVLPDGSKSLVPAAWTDLTSSRSCQRLGFVRG
jgi:hypothetical protein